MGMMRELPDIIDEAGKRAEFRAPHGFQLGETWDPEILGFPQLSLDLDSNGLGVAPDPASSPSLWNRPEDHKIYFGDNLRLMKYLWHEREVVGKINMMYIDPPFFTKADYDAVLNIGTKKVRHPAYEDTWHSGMREYLTQLAETLILMKDLLADDGLIWVHLDWHAVHYARVLLDEIFGQDHFVNEIVWEYKSGGSTKKRFARKHDNILVYSKGDKFKFHPLKEKSYNRGLKPYHFKGVEEFQDEKGWFTMVNMRDVWKLDMVGRTSAERTGYATQKPESLLKRIIQCCTDPGDLVADFFSGSGTTGVVAGKLGRRSICCDRAGLAIEKTLERFCSNGIGSSIFVEEHPTPVEEDGSVSVTVKFDGDRISIGDVQLDAEYTMMDAKSKRALAEAIKENVYDVIASWSVDENYDGKVYRPEQLLVRDKKGLELSTELHTGHGEIVVKVVTIMGNVEYIRVLQER